MSETHECGFDFKHDTCVCAKCGEPFTSSTRDDCHGAVVVESKRVAPSAETPREWLLSQDLEMLLGSHIGVSGKYLCELLEAYHAYRTSLSPSAPSCDEKDAQTRVSDERLEELIATYGGDFYLGAFRSIEDEEDIPELLRELLSIRRSAAPPAATNCCTATEVEAARNPEKSLEERAQEAAEEIAREFLVPLRPHVSAYEIGVAAWSKKVKAIILSRIGGAE